MVSTWRRLGYKSQEAFSRELRRLYVDESLSHELIGEQLGVHVETIRKLCAEYGIRARPRNEALFLRWHRSKSDVQLSDDEKEVLVGLLLGDGHLALSESGRSARYTHGEKHRSMLQRIAADLPSLEFSCIKKYNGYYFFKSLSYEALLPMRLEWYGSDRKQRVPAGLRLTPRSLYWFYIGDGSYNKKHVVRLSTDGYEDESIVRIQLALRKLHIETTVAGRRVFVRSRSHDSFFETVGPCRDKEYAHKWPRAH